MFITAVQTACLAVGANYYSAVTLLIEKSSFWKIYIKRHDCAARRQKFWHQPLKISFVNSGYWIWIVLITADLTSIGLLRRFLIRHNWACDLFGYLWLHERIHFSFETTNTFFLQVFHSVLVISQQLMLIIVNHYRKFVIELLAS